MTGAEGINYVTVRIDDKKCERCYNCVRACTNGSLTLERGIFTHNPYTCINEELCMDMCPNDAIIIRSL